MKSYRHIPRGENQKLMDCVSDAAAIHVLLHSMQYPTQYIVWDGDKYWMFNALSPHGWGKKVEYRGHTHHLKICPAYMAAVLMLPFKIRDVAAEWWHGNWGDYQARG